MQVQPMSNSIPSFNLQTKSYFALAGAFVHRVYTASLPVFTTLSSIYCINVGINELSSKCSLKPAKNCPDDSYSLRFSGIAFIGTGICDACVTLHSLSIFNFNRAITKINFIGNICFLYASLATLAESVSLFQKAQSEPSGSEQSKERMQSAFLGIISSLGYIVTCALTVFGGSTAVIILLSIFAAHTAYLKIIIDYSNHAI